MKKPFSLFSLVSLFLVAMLAGGMAHAEKADSAKPMNIEADALRHDDLKQISVFTGNVVVTKGTIILRGAQLEVRQDAQGYQFGVMTAEPGKRAFFRQKRDTAPGAPDGYSNILAGGQNGTLFVHIVIPPDVDTPTLGKKLASARSRLARDWRKRACALRTSGAALSDSTSKASSSGSSNCVHHAASVAGATAAALIAGSAVRHAAGVATAGCGAAPACQAIGAQAASHTDKSTTLSDTAFLQIDPTKPPKCPDQTPALRHGPKHAMRSSLLL